MVAWKGMFQDITHPSLATLLGRIGRLAAPTMVLLFALLGIFAYGLIIASSVRPSVWRLR